MHTKLIQNTQNETIMSIQYLEHAGYVAAEWQGYLTAEEIQVGLNTVLDFAHLYNCQFLLYNRYNTLATPTIIQNWLVEDYMPRVVKSPLRYVAYVKPNNFLSGASSVQALNAIRNFGVEFGICDTPAEGLLWLSQQMQQLKAS